MEELKRQLTEMAEGVERFHREVQDLPVHTDPIDGGPGALPEHRKRFRADFLFEELTEYRDAVSVYDEIDALVDLVYVAIGALLEMGVNPIAAFRPVQEANMAKVRGETKRGEAYDAIKPEGWTPPDHLKVLEELALRARVSEVFLEATQIVIQRGADYNHGKEVRREDHFPFGMVSIFQMMWVKVMRMKADLAAGRPVKRDHLIDLINYSRFGVDLIDGRPML